MRYQILEGLPTDGPAHIPVPLGGSRVYSQGFVVRFYKKDGTSWVANFECGSGTLFQVYDLQAGKSIIVVAGGKCYFMNPDDTSPLVLIGGSYDAGFPATNNRIVLADNSRLTIIEPDGTYWHSEEIALNGMKELRIENGIISGLADSFTEEPMRFSYDIERKFLKW